MFNSNGLWWYEYKYDDSATNHSSHIVYIKHVNVVIYNSVWCCIILHIFDSNSIIYCRYNVCVKQYKYY